MKFQSLAPAALFGFSLLGGWLWNRPPQDSVATDEVRPSPRAAREATKPGALPSAVAARLAAVRDAPNAAERLRASIQLAWEVPVGELPQWYEKQAYGLKGAELNVFYDITRRRWLEDEPEGMMDLAFRRNWDSINDIAAQWTRADPARALAYLRSRGDSAAKLWPTLLSRLAETHPDEVLEMVQRPPLGGEQPLQGLFAILAKLHPEKLAAAADSWPPSLSRLAESELLSQRFLRDFPGEIGRLTEMPDGKARFIQLCQSSHGMTAKLLQHRHHLPPGWIDAAVGKASLLTSRDPEQWLSADLESAGVGPEAAKRFRGSALLNLSLRNPSKALPYLDLVDFSNPADRSAFRHVVLALAGKDPAAAEQWLARVPAGNPEFNDQLRAALHDKLNPPAAKPPAASLISQIRDIGKVRESPLQTLTSIRSLPEADRAAFFNDFSRLPGAEQAEISRSLLGTTDLGSQPSMTARFIDTALAHPTPAADPAGPSRRDPLPSAASRLAVRWVLDDPPAATRWLATLPAGDSRQWALRNTASNWRAYDTPAAEAWIATLPPAEQADVRRHLIENP